VCVKVRASTPSQAAAGSAEGTASLALALAPALAGADDPGLLQPAMRRVATIPRGRIAFMLRFMLGESS
jgi:hypothetical protein